MKILKTLLVALLGLVGLILIAGLVIPTAIETESEIIMDAPIELAYATVNDLSTWQSWSPWKEMDPTMEVTLAEQTKGAGASYDWVGETSGTGTMKITDNKDAEWIKTAITFDGMEGSTALFNFVPEGEATKVSWAFSTSIPYPFNTFTYLQGMEGAVKKDFDRGLELLKGRVEKQAIEQAQENPYALSVEASPALHFIGVRTTKPIAEMMPFFAEQYPIIKEAMATAKLIATGPAAALFYTYDIENNQSDFAVVYPVEQPVSLEGFESITIPSRKALSVEHQGGYSDTYQIYGAFEEYMASQQLQENGPALEFYNIGPLDTQDSTKWKTSIYYGVQ
ncbi:MAG: SRPBCC family protein [Bacteroidota bacterium]